MWPQGQPRTHRGDWGVILLCQDSGEYTLEASNGHGRVSHQWRLRVDAKEEPELEENKQLEEEVIHTDETVVSGDISDPQFIQLMVRRT